MSLRVLLKDRDFRFLFAGQSLSMFGDMAMLVVLGIWAKSLTGSNGVAGSVYAAFAAPSLLMFLAGPPDRPDQTAHFDDCYGLGHGPSGVVTPLGAWA